MTETKTNLYEILTKFRGILDNRKEADARLTELVTSPRLDEMTDEELLAGLREVNAMRTKAEAMLTRVVTALRVKYSPEGVGALYAWNKSEFDKYDTALYTTTLTGETNGNQ